MKAEVKQKWVEALRSGKFKQTKGCLADSKGYCCLGVLCEVAIAEGVELEKYAYENSIPLQTYDKSVYTLPKRVEEWADFWNDGPMVDIAGTRRPLADHNDSGRTFEEIAKAIEEQL